MTPSKFVHLIIIVFLLVIISCINERSSQQQPHQERNSLAARDVMPREKYAVIIGSVAVFEDKTVLMTREDDFYLVGKDMSALAGAMVRISGTLIEDQDGKIIRVSAYEKLE